MSAIAEHVGQLLASRRKEPEQRERSTANAKQVHAESRDPIAAADRPKEECSGVVGTPSMSSASFHVDCALPMN
jgi:hypothetical protein